MSQRQLDFFKTWEIKANQSFHTRPLGAHLSPSWHDCAMGICPRSCEPSEPRLEPGRPSDTPVPECRTRKRQANHWTGSANQAEACHITLRPGRPTAKYQFLNARCQLKICFHGDLYPWVGGFEWAQCCGLHRALYEPHGRREV